MKKLIAIAIAATALAGCQSVAIKTPEWEATIKSHWFRRDVDKLAVQRLADGSYSVDLNGYKGDASEQLPAFTKEMWAGLGILGRIAATAVNPAASAVPLTAEAADATQVAALVKASADAKAALASAKAELEKAKADLAAAQAAQTTEKDCADGSCTK